ncbi:MAG: phenylacetate--CoA ligase family protein [Candidatus Adiutrix sp.]|nr:phenylacetate--CoA ligase family protein [Candidatus Adiutrix sp.]
MPGSDEKNSPWLDLQLLNRLPADLRESRPEASLAHFRVRLLKRTIEHAIGRSPHYRRQMEAAGAALEILTAVKTHDDASTVERLIQAALACLPFTRPDELAAAPDDFLAVSQTEVEGVISLPSSGSTGPVKRVYSSASDLESTVDFFFHGMRGLVSLKNGDRAALMMSGDRPGSVGDLLSRAMARLRIPMMLAGFPPQEAGSRPTWLKKLIDWRPSCLVGLPRQVLELSRCRLAASLSPGLRTILLSGDVVAESARRHLADALTAEVFIHYGLTEFGLGGAVECRERLGPHLREADLLVEIIGPDGRTVNEAGRRGEIVITSLTRQAMPLLRYRTGDEGAFAPGPCACGSIMRRLLTFGRLADRISLADGRHLGLSDFEEALLPLPFVRWFELTLHEDGLRPYLVLAASLAEPPPANALDLIAKALSGLSGLHPAANLEKTFPSALLPLLVTIADDSRKRNMTGKQTLKKASPT